MCYTIHPGTLSHIIHIAATKHLGTKSVGRHKDELMACVVFELVPMGNWEQRAHKCRGGDLYF